jgi:PAS domain S-box-containing protein
MLRRRAAAVRRRYGTIFLDAAYETLPRLSRPCSIAETMASQNGGKASEVGNLRPSDSPAATGLASPDRTEFKLRGRISALETALAEARTRAARAENLVDSALDYAIITLDLSGVVTGWSAGAQAMLGYGEAEIVGRSAEILFTSEDRNAGRLATEMARALAEGRANNERWHLKRDGTRYWASGLMMPLLGGDGGAEGFLTIFRDRTDEQAATERRELLMAEMNHRIKNVFSVVQAIATRTLRLAPDLEAFQPAFAGRLAALARSQDVLIRGNWEHAPLAEVIEAATGGFGASGQITLEGPPVTLGAGSIVTVSLAFHELTTNALKHGALSTPTGRVDVRWNTGPDARGAEKVHVAWCERGGPAVSPPSRQGFGSQLLERGMPRGGHVAMDFQSVGLECRICLPLDRNGQS